jgi:kynureninase
MRTDADYARDLDRGDPLAEFRDRFVIDGPEIYLDGNSLGRMPKSAIKAADDLIRRQWGQRLIRGWNDGWLELSQRIGGKIARLLGAGEDEVVVADSTTVNLFKLAVAAVRARPGRHVVVTDDLNFPSDVHALGSALKAVGPNSELRIVRSPDGIGMTEEVLAKALGADTALLMLSHTVFRSGFTYDVAAVTRLAHRAGALVLWDVSHSVGTMPLHLNAAAADLAVGCTYKYLCAGPGGPAFLYVRRELQELLQNPIAGWLGGDDPFSFSLEYRPAAGLRRFITGTPPVISLALVEPGVDEFLAAGLDSIRAKGVAQTEYLISLWEEWLAPLGFALKTPRNAGERGCHVALGHSEGWRISQALIEREQIICDFRPPDNLRLGMCPLYTTYTEIRSAAEALRRIVAERVYDQYPATRQGVT